jgi:hypothetical protein
MRPAGVGRLRQCTMAVPALAASEPSAAHALTVTPCLSRCRRCPFPDRLPTCSPLQLWGGVSQEAKDLVRCLLQSDPQQRLTAPQVGGCVGAAALARLLTRPQPCPSHEK